MKNIFLTFHFFRWTYVESGKRVNIKDETEVFGSATKLYAASLRYLDKMRDIASEQVDKLRWVNFQLKIRLLFV